MEETDLIIEQTRKWITNVVIGCNFCPFAANVAKQEKVHYQVEKATDIEICLATVLQEAKRLDDKKNIETTLIIYPDSFLPFNNYLDFVSLAENLLKQHGYEGIYQLASFHPLYQFAGSEEDDAANYTNRSVYPMLHFLREESIDKALANYKKPEDIPVQNIHFAREKGLLYMKMLREACI